MVVTFTKMQGMGNDFIVLQGPVQLSSEQIARYCDRHYGIGADGLLIVSPIGSSQVKMEYWNADGSVAEMCGNGLRCVARFAVDNQLVEPGTFTVQTAVGPLQVSYDGKAAENIEAQIGKVNISNKPLTLQGEVFYAANVGNPHAITFVDDLTSAPVQTLGPQIETDPHFPHKTNVEFVRIMSPDGIKVRVWERGVGETLSCATAIVACALTTTKVKAGLLPITVEVPGGQTTVWLDKEGFARMKGPAEMVFSGELDERR